MATTSKSATAKPASDGALRDLASAGADELADLGIDAAARLKMAQAETAQKARMLAEPTEKILVPRNITVMPALRVQVNGVAFSLPIGVEVSAPSSVVALAKQHIAAALASEDRGRAQS